ncbi:hypothetical protein DPV78_012129 [Talaromyces pinophilus]|jgi:hypothetical protein|nr:hypothetical protein DPV78_012129 [Talaromyces pinophilus]
MPDTRYFLAEDPIIAPAGTMSRFSIDKSERNHFAGLLEQTSEVKKKSMYSLRQKRRSTITKEIEVPIPPQRQIHHHHHHHSVNMLDP